MAIGDELAVQPFLLMVTPTWSLLLKVLTVNILYVASVATGKPLIVKVCVSPALLVKVSVSPEHWLVLLATKVAVGAVLTVIVEPAVCVLQPWAE